MCTASMEGKGSTAQILIARNPVFQPNPQIRCLVSDNLKKNCIEIFCFEVR
jgi:hypothetical protein